MLLSFDPLTQNTPRQEMRTPSLLAREIKSIDRTALILSRSNRSFLLSIDTMQPDFKQLTKKTVVFFLQTKPISSVKSVNIEHAQGFATV